MLYLTNIQFIIAETFAMHRQSGHFLKDCTVSATYLRIIEILQGLVPRAGLYPWLSPCIPGQTFHDTGYLFVSERFPLGIQR